MAEALKRRVTSNYQVLPLWVDMQYKKLKKHDETHFKYSHFQTCLYLSEQMFPIL